MRSKASCQWSNTARPTLPHPLFGLKCERRRSVQPDQRRVVALELYFIDWWKACCLILFHLKWDKVAPYRLRIIIDCFVKSNTSNRLKELSSSSNFYPSNRKKWRMISYS
jgi:hypothetical protein